LALFPKGLVALARAIVDSSELFSTANIKRRHQYRSTLSRGEEKRVLYAVVEQEDGNTP
jgi:hypothetical protein